MIEYNKVIEILDILSSSTDYSEELAVAKRCVEKIRDNQHLCLHCEANTEGGCETQNIISCKYFKFKF